MSFDGFVARRYLLARRKQAFIWVISLITLGGISLGVAGLNIALAIHNGMHAAFIKSLVGDTGQLHIVSSGYQSQGFKAQELENIMEVLNRTPGVRASAVMRQESGVAISRRKRLQYVNIYGIIPTEYTSASNNLDKLESGSIESLKTIPEGAPFPVILGADLARHLGVRQGDRVRLAVPRLSSPGLARRSSSSFKLKELSCEVTGIFKTGNSQFDERDAYLNLGVLFRLLNTTEIQSILVTFSSLEALDAAKTDLITDPDLPSFATVIDFRDLNAGLLEALKLEKLATTAIIGLFIVIVALNMISALIMLVMEKHRDIGIMRSFGTPRKTILRIFIRQGMTLAVLGTVIGTVLGVTGSYICDSYRLISLDNSVYEVLSYLPFKVRPVEVTLVALGSLLLSLLTTIFPAWQAARLDPVEALKYD